MTDAPSPSPPPSLIETISTGFVALNQRPGVLIIPIALNLFLWLGTRLSLEPFLSQQYETLSFFVSFLTTESLQQDQIIYSIQNADMRLPLALLNVVPVLALTGQRTSPLHTPPEIQVSGGGEVVIAALIVNGLALALSSIYLTELGFGVERLSEHRAESIGPRLQKAALVALRIVGYLVLLVLILFVVGGPFFILLVLASQAFSLIVPLVVLVGFLAWLYLSLYTGYAIEAIVISEVGPYQALVNSITMVHRYFLSALGLWLLSVLIRVGLGIVWEQVSYSLLGLLAAIVGSAYVGSGLAAARFVFYRDRKRLQDRLIG